ncbi:hypothetical protein HDV02_005497 [Globomyces sp. JEL0801]|nr:hypothetical protein HDV02_005497 [Globomyces sp. JEL0801]
MDQNNNNHLAPYDMQQNPQKKSKGKRKIEMKYIENKVHRRDTFYKRKSGVMQKVHELSVLTGNDILLVMKSDSGNIFSYATPSFQSMFSKESQDKTLKDNFESIGISPFQIHDNQAWKLSVTHQYPIKYNGPGQPTPKPTAIKPAQNISSQSVSTQNISSQSISSQSVSSQSNASPNPPKVEKMQQFSAPVKVQSHLPSILDELNASFPYSQPSPVEPFPSNSQMFNNNYNGLSFSSTNNMQHSNMSSLNLPSQRFNHLPNDVLGTTPSDSLHQLLPDKSIDFKYPMGSKIQYNMDYSLPFDPNDPRFLSNVNGQFNPDMFPDFNLYEKL